MPTAEQLTESIAHHGEGAVWYDGWGGLRWVDMLAGDILSLDETSGAVGRTPVGSPVAACIRPRVDGGFVVATEREFAVWGESGREWVSPPLWSPGIRFNEGSCDPDGAFWCGSMAYDTEHGAGSLWRLGADRRIEEVYRGVTISNGLGFSGDGRHAYYVDTRTRRIDRFDFVEGTLRDRRPFVSVGDGLGNPDGLCVDAEDGVWVALYGGSAVHHYSADGRLDEVVDLPVTKITSCTLGGPDLTTLYITTSRENLEAHEQPLAGALFQHTGAGRGRPVLPAAI